MNSNEVVTGAKALIAGALVADGTGAPLERLDVLIEGKRIIAVEPHGAISAQGDWQVIRADALVLAPGFIDVHSHADLSPLLSDDDTTKILQGVTTEVVGNCGQSLAPLAPGREQETRATVGGMFPDVPMQWHGFGEMMDTLDTAGYVTNYCPLVGHGALRVAIVGAEARAATGAELSRMKDMLALALSEGAFGFSSGLIYSPGVFSDLDELAGLASVLSSSRVYATHMRNESDALMDSIEEALTVGERTGCKVQVSHLKSAGRSNWGSSAHALRRLDAARAKGVRVTQDVYPYIAASTTLTACLPPWAHDGGEEMLLERLTNPSTLRKLREDIEAIEAQDWENPIRGSGYDGIMVASTSSHDFEGRTLSQLAEELGTDPFEAMVTVLRAERLRVSMVEFAMAEGDVEAIMANEWTMIASDGLPVGTGGKPHPRLHGTFPRVLGRYVRDRGVLDLGTAIHKMTGQPAEVFGIPDRGKIAAGAVADLVAFSPQDVADVGTYQDPAHAPAGINWVMQGGRTVVQDGRWLGVRSGARLLPW
ncbi:MAG: N-acyl-D-amino-acid deacylase family protein [Dermatophilaceae bacterium]